MNRGSIAKINLSAITSNLQFVRRLVKDRKIIAVVKADAYGHGAVEVSRRLIKNNILYLAVAFTSEAVELRNAGITAPILVLFDRENIKEFFDYNLIPVIYNVKVAKEFSREAQKRGSKVNIHIKIDTGMGRVGLRDKNVIKEIIKISKMDGLELKGIMSHFSEADLSDRSFAVLQLTYFQEIVEKVKNILKKKVLSHISNSAAVLSFYDAYLDAVRPGLMLYGYSPLNKKSGERSQKSQEAFKTYKSLDNHISLIPAMKIVTKILCIRKVPAGSPISYGRTFITKRPSIIGVVPLGYADGYSRLFSNNAEVLVKGKRAPIVGMICMDLFMVDLTDIKGVKEDDEVVILGKQGKEFITAYELAKKAKTIPYEILTLLGRNSRKVYVKDPSDE